MFQVNLKKIFNNQNILIDEMELEPGQLYDHIPLVDEDYVFELKILNEILLYLAHPFNDCLYISGPSGCGKTSMVMQIAARLNWGVEQITLSNKSEASDLIGHTTLKKNELVFEYGPLARAMLYGEILILNEIDLMAPGDLSLLNDVLDGKALTVLSNNGEIIKPHPQFRVIATANTKGVGDMSGFYNGARLLNQAFLDRFRFMEMDYPKPKAEYAMIAQACPTLDKEMIDKIIKFAHELRAVVKLGLENGVRQLSAPFSSRTLLKIARMKSLNYDLSIHRIVKMCFALRLPSVELEYVMRLVNDIFGHEKEVLIKTSVTDLEESSPKLKETRKKASQKKIADKTDGKTDSETEKKAL